MKHINPPKAPDDDDWFRRLQTMDIDEADALCRDALNHFKAMMRPGRDNQSETLTISRLNTEVHLISTRQQRTDLYAAIRALWGDDGIQQVKEWRAIERAKLTNQP